jgi:hypothetical protein
MFLHSLPYYNPDHHPARCPLLRIDKTQHHGDGSAFFRFLLFPNYDHTDDDGLWRHDPTPGRLGTYHNHQDGGPPGPLRHTLTSILIATRHVTGLIHTGVHQCRRQARQEAEVVGPGAPRA